MGSSFGIFRPYCRPTKTRASLPNLECTSASLRDPILRMLARHALKYHHPVACLPELLPTGSYCRSYSKSTTTNPVSKPKITKKKYSELPALHPLCETTPNAVLGSEIVSNTQRTRYSRILERVCLLLLPGAVC